MCVHCITVPSVSVFPGPRDAALDPRELQRETEVRAQMSKTRKEGCILAEPSREVTDCWMNARHSSLSTSLRSCSTYLIIIFSSYSAC